MSFTYVAAFSANVISFIGATAITWSSPILPKLNSTEKNPFDYLISEEEKSWISAFLPLGATLGPFIYGFLADKFGRKLSLLICDIPFIVSYLLLAFGKTPAIYYVARFIIGTSVGGVFTVIPMYVGEIAEDSNRGALGSSMNCFICFGLLFSYSVGPYTSISTFNILLALFPAIFLPLFFFLAPESPHYLASKGEFEKVKDVLHKIRSGDEKIEKELFELQEKVKEEGHASFFDIFKSKGLTKALAIGSGLLAFQQFSGINAVLSYSQNIFEQAGTSLPSEVCAILIGCTQVVTSFLTPLIVDRLGRKILLIISAVGMAVVEIPLGVYSFMKEHDEDVSAITFLPILCLIGYIITYNTAFGPLPWALIGELFPANVKSIASAASAAVCWFLGFLITKFFPSISNCIGMGVSFWIFGSCCIAAVPFCVFYVIETKGKSLSEIQQKLNR